MNVQEKYSDWLEKATAAAQKKYGQGVDLDKVKAAVDNLLDVFSEDEDVAREAHKKVSAYISYPVDKSSRFSYPVEKLSIEAIVGKKFSGNLYARAKALTDWTRVQEGKDACDVNRPSLIPQTKNRVGKLVTAYINKVRKDKKNNLPMAKYAFNVNGYTMYTDCYIAVRTKEDWELDKAAFTKGVAAPPNGVWENIDKKSSVAIRIDRYQVEVFADVNLQVDFKVAEGLSLYLNTKQVMFLFNVLQADSLVFYTPNAKTIEGRHPCYFGSIWYCKNEHGEAAIMPIKHDGNEHPIVCDISKQVQVIDGKEVVTMAKATKVEKVKQTTKEVAPMKKSAKCKALENALKKSEHGYATMYEGKLLVDTAYYTIWTDAEWSKAFDPALILENKVDSLGFPVAVTKDGEELSSFSWFLHTIKKNGNNDRVCGWAYDSYDYYKRKGDATFFMLTKADGSAKYGVSMEDMKEVTKILTSTAVSLTFDKRFDSNFVYHDDHTDMVIRSVKESKKEDNGMSKTIPTNCVGCDRISNDEQGKPFCNFHGPSIDLSERGNHGCSYRDGKKKTTANAIRNKAEQVAGKEWADKHLVVATTAPTTPAVTSKATAKATKKTTAKKSAKVEAPTPQPSQFAGLTTMEQVRQRYMELVQQGVEPSIELVRQYTIAFMSAHEAELKAAQDSGKYIGRLLKEQSPTEGYLEAINVALQLAKNNGVEVKVEGCYIWISNTKREDMECRNALKGAGFWWARNRKQWYWRPAFLYKKEA